MSLLYELPKPIVIAHRGASKFAPENTLSAFRLAQSLGVPAIELDVKLSADEEVVIMHDAQVDRTTDGHGLVKSLKLTEIRSFDAGSWFDSCFHDVRVPTLDEVLEEFHDGMLINIELTNYNSIGDNLVEKTAYVVRRHNSTYRVLFSSFFPWNLVSMRRYIPKASFALLAWEGRMGTISRGWIGRRVSPLISHPYFTDVDERFVQGEHARHRRVHVWTVNNTDDIHRMYKIKVDGVFTDDPQLALSLRRAE